MPPRLLPYLLAVLAGLLAFAAFPPLDIGPLIYLALALLFFSIAISPRPRSAALAGLLYGLAFYAPLLFYITQFGTIPWLLLVLFESLFLAALAALAAAANPLQRPLLKSASWAALWVLFEFLRSNRGPLSLPLGDIYYTQWNLPPIIQIASIFGSHAISFLIAWLAAALAITAAAWLPALTPRLPAPSPLYARNSARALLIAYVAFFAAYFWGSWAYRSGTALIASLPEDAGIKVGLAQSASKSHIRTLPEDIPAARAAYFRLTDALPDDIDLLVWPETAIPALYAPGTPLYLDTRRIAREKSCWFLFGANEPAPHGRLYNSAILLDPSGREAGRYIKNHLIIFGEYVPWRDKLKFLRHFPIRDFDYQPGQGFQPLQMAGKSFGVLICFEVLFPRYTATLCRKGAQFLVFITSDAWAANTYEVAQHSRTAVFRAVEARRFVVRSATHGESQVITPFGQLLVRLPIRQAAADVATIYPISALSLYHRLGDWPLLLLCAALWLAASASLPEAARANRGPAED